MFTNKEIREIITLLRDPEIKLLVEQDSVNFDYIAKIIEDLLLASDRWRDECKTLRGEKLRSITKLNNTYLERKL